MFIATMSDRLSRAEYQLVSAIVFATERCRKCGLMANSFTGSRAAPHSPFGRGRRRPLVSDEA